MNIDIAMKFALYAVLIVVFAFSFYVVCENDKLFCRIDSLDNECKYHENETLASLSKSLSVRIEVKTLKDQVAELIERNNKLDAQIKHKKYIPVKHGSIPVTEYVCVNSIRDIFISGNKYKRDTSILEVFCLFSGSKSFSYVVNPLDFHPVKTTANV